MTPLCLICLTPFPLALSLLPLFAKQPPKYLVEVQGRHFCCGNSTVCMCAGGEMGEKVVIGVSHKIYSEQLYRDLLEQGVH